MNELEFYKFWSNIFAGMLVGVMPMGREDLKEMVSAFLEQRYDFKGNGEISPIQALKCEDGVKDES